MKSTACLINTGRASLTDEDAILDALENNKIRAAALDVYSKEPLGNDRRVYSIPEEKFIITPHIVGLAVDQIPHQYENLMKAVTTFQSEAKIYTIFTIKMY